MKLRAGILLPWTIPPYGYRLHPDRPRDPAGVQIEPTEGAIIQELFVRYPGGGGTPLRLRLARWHLFFVKGGAVRIIRYILVRSVKCCKPRHTVSAPGWSRRRRPTNPPSCAIQRTAWSSEGGL